MANILCLRINTQAAGNDQVETRKWVGASEAAALLRFLGLQAMIADFKGAPLIWPAWLQPCWSTV